MLILPFTSNDHFLLNSLYNLIPHELLVLCAFNFPKYVNQSDKMESPRHTFVGNNKEELLAFRGLGDDDEGSRCVCLTSVREKIKNCWISLQDFSGKAWEMGRSDPRKIIFGIKMGLALSIVTLLIFWRETYHDIGQYSIWAILTVIVMFEFSIGMIIIV